MASVYTSLPTVSVGEITIGEVSLGAGAAHIGSVTLDTQGGPTGDPVPDDAVMVGGTDGTNLRAIAVDSTGVVQVNAISALYVVGEVAQNVGMPILGKDTTGDYQLMRMDTDGGPIIAGTGQNSETAPGVAVHTAGVDSTGETDLYGAAVAGSAFPSSEALYPIAGSDGTNARALLLDSTGKPIISGTGAVGSAIPSAGIAVIGTDGTDARVIRVDSSGFQLVGGANATGSAVPTGAFFVAGSDGTNVKAISVSTGGQVIIAGMGAPGAATPVAAISVGGTDGTNLRGFSVTSTGAIKCVSNQIEIATGFTRPSNTTAYAANDVVADSTSAATILTFANAGAYSGGGGYITRVSLQKNSTTVTAATFRLWIMNDSVTMINDADPFNLLYSNAGKIVGYFDLNVINPNGSGGSGDSAYAYIDTPRTMYTCAATSLYGILVVTQAYTPTSAEQFGIKIGVDRN